MQVNTIIRLGSLAFNVAQDEKVQELLTMLHNGAKRRGVIGPIAPPTAFPKPSQPQSASSQNETAKAHPVPFAPKPHQPWNQLPPGPDLSKYLNMNNAKKVMGWAGQISSLLVK